MKVKSLDREDFPVFDVQINHNRCFSFRNVNHGDLEDILEVSPYSYLLINHTKYPGVSYTCSSGFSENVYLDDVLFGMFLLPNNMEELVNELNTIFPYINLEIIKKLNFVVNPVEDKNTKYTDKFPASLIIFNLTIDRKEINDLACKNLSVIIHHILRTFSYLEVYNIINPFWLGQTPTIKLCLEISNTNVANGQDTYRSLCETTLPLDIFEGVSANLINLLYSSRTMKQTKILTTLDIYKILNKKTNIKKEVSNFFKEVLEQGKIILSQQIPMKKILEMALIDDDPLDIGSICLDGEPTLLVNGSVILAKTRPIELNWPLDNYISTFISSYLFIQRNKEKLSDGSNKTLYEAFRKLSYGGYYYPCVRFCFYSEEEEDFYVELNIPIIGKTLTEEIGLDIF